MRSIVGLLLALAIALGIYYFYLKRVETGGPGTSPAQAISLTGVQSDLLAIAQAERIYFAERGAYGSLDELTSRGALTVPRSGRDGYQYTVDTSAAGFTVIARYTGPRAAGNKTSYPTIPINQSMEIHRED